MGVFCSNCGAELQNGVAFCSNCGSSVNANVPSRSTGTRANEAALEELTRMHDWFSQKERQYYDFDRLSAALPKLQHVNLKALLIFGIIIFNFAIVLVAFDNSTVRGLGVFFMIVGLGMIGGFIAAQIVRTNKAKNYQARLDAVTVELMEHYEQYGDCPLSIDNTYPYFIAELYNLVKGGRADTIKEALNISINDQRMNEMTSLARQTAISAQQAARGAKAAAAFSAVSAFRRR